jgi:putative DNA primase/helicase
LFQVFEFGSGPVRRECFQSASRLMAWHLSESRRFFGELALPDELAAAQRLEAWLRDYCQREHTTVVGKTHVRQHGPLREGTTLEVALQELVALDRLRVRKAGRRLTVELNPALLERAGDAP